jgi:dynein heavy chain
LLEAEEMLKKNRDKFKARLLQQSEEFRKNISELANEFKTRGPFSADAKPEEVKTEIHFFCVSSNLFRENFVWAYMFVNNYQIICAL